MIRDEGRKEETIACLRGENPPPPSPPPPPPPLFFFLQTRKKREDGSISTLFTVFVFVWAHIHMAGGWMDESNISILLYFDFKLTFGADRRMS